MKSVIIIMVILLALVLALVAMAYASRQQSPVGLVDGRLSGCPNSPNCLCSESGIGVDDSHAILPLELAGVSPEQAWHHLQEVVRQAGGRIEKQGDHYMHATFSSALFGFVDDVEARLDRQAGMIHLRSASRVGHADFGANRKRMDCIRQKFSSR